MRVADEHVRDFREKGWFILDRAIPPDTLDALRAECRRFIDMADARMDELGTDVVFINHRNKRYFLTLPHQESPVLIDFLYGDLMEAIIRATLGDTAYLFFSQYVVKCAEVGMKFAWHQDGGYIPFEHKPYISCWIALDDMSEENGTVYMLPYDKAGTRERIEHRQEAGSNDLVGYFGDEPGEPAIVPAGSIVVFSSNTFHRSGANQTRNMRRAYLVQYSVEPIMKPEGDGFLWDGVPFLIDGRRQPPPELPYGNPLSDLRREP